MKPRIAILISVLVAMAAWAGLAGMVRQFQPAPPLLAAALALVAIAVAGTTMPFWYLLQRRLAPKRNPKTLVGVAVREGVWTGLFAAALLFLRVNDLLNGVLVLVLAVVLFLLETFLQQRGAARLADSAGSASRISAARSHPARSTTAGNSTARTTARRDAPRSRNAAGSTAPKKAGGRPAAAYQRTDKSRPVAKGRQKGDGNK